MAIQPTLGASRCRASGCPMDATRTYKFPTASQQHSPRVDAADPAPLLPYDRRPRAILDVMGPIEAFYEGGLLRPISPLPLRSGERVAVIVMRRPDASRWNLERLAMHGDDDLALAEAGLDEWAAALEREDGA
jgi:predicted DNA-binding antitoxin AbrB/MazE fold protein